MPLLRSTSTFLLAAALAACGALPARPSLSDRTIEIEVVDSRNASIATDRAAGLRFASFPLTQGSLTGAMTADPVLFLPVKAGFAAQLPLAELARRVAPLAMPPDDQMRADGLTVSPADTRLARVGAFFVEREEDRVDVEAGFLDDATRETFFLVYFDRACSVAGMVRIAGIDIAVDVRAQRDGLYWLRIVKDDATHWHLAADDTQAPLALVLCRQALTPAQSVVGNRSMPDDAVVVFTLRPTRRDRGCCAQSPEISWLASLRT